MLSRAEALALIGAARESIERTEADGGRTRILIDACMKIADAHQIELNDELGRTRHTADEERAGKAIVAGLRSIAPELSRLGLEVVSTGSGGFVCPITDRECQM